MIAVKVKAIELVRLQRMLESPVVCDEARALIDSWLADPARQLAPEPQRISVRFAAISVGTRFYRGEVALHKTSTVAALRYDEAGRYTVPGSGVRFRAGDVVEIDRAGAPGGDGGRK